MEWGSIIFHFFAGTSKCEFPICWLVVYGFSSLLPSSFPATIQANFAKHLPVPEHLRLHKKAAKQKASSTTNSLRKATKPSATSSNPTVFSPTFSQLKRVPGACQLLPRRFGEGGCHMGGKELAEGLLQRQQLCHRSLTTAEAELDFWPKIL